MRDDTLLDSARFSQRKRRAEKRKGTDSKSLAPLLVQSELPQAAHLWLDPCIGL
jgi:hypothetical protein